MTEVTSSQHVDKKHGNMRGGRSIAGEEIPVMPPSLRRNTTVEIELACDNIQATYAEFVSGLQDIGSFGSMPNLKNDHYFHEHGAQHDSKITGATMKHIIKEVTKTLPGQLEVHARGSMFVRYDEDSPNYLRACLTGIEGTPYSSGIFVFDIYLPCDYPNVPCMVKHVTKNADLVHANNGPGGFSPNLHSDSGQVCLSLLGTWDGPGWDPAISNVYQVLSSILYMILGAQHPYYMEPGFGGWEGNSPARLEDDPDMDLVIEYDEEVKIFTASLCILDTLRSPPQGFESVVTGHFMTKRRLIRSTMDKWIKHGSPRLKTELPPILAWINEEIKSRMTEHYVMEDIQEVEQTIAFINRKMCFLEKKVRDAGGRDMAKTAIPLAWKRYCLGPALLREAEELLLNLKALLLECKHAENKSCR